MGMGTTTNVSTGKPKTSGAIFYNSDMTKTLPTSATATLTDYVHLGYVDESGLTNSNSPSSDKQKAWGGDVVLTYQTEKEDTFKFKLIESTNADVLKVVYGEDNITTNTDGSIKAIKANAKELSDAQWVIDIALRDGFKRICIPQGKITEVGDIVYTDTEAIGYELTITATPDEDGNTHYEYFG